MAKDYDNSDRLALWKPDRQAVIGYGEFDGEKVDAAIVPTGAKSDRAPTHRLFLSYRDRTDAACVALWKEDDKWGGQIDGWWVNVYVNAEKRSDAGPDVSVVFKRKEEREPGRRGGSREEYPRTNRRDTAPAPAGGGFDDDDSIPFAPDVPTCCI